jgi:hypothetical protein
MNAYNRYYKQVKEWSLSGVNTKVEIQKVAADYYRDAEGHAFSFSHFVEVLRQLPKFNPMVDHVDRSSDVAVEDLDGDKKPAASVNKIGAPMGASLKRPPGSEKSKAGVAACPDQLLLLLPWRRWHRVTLHWSQLKIGWLFLKLQTKHVFKQSRSR